MIPYGVRALAGGHPEKFGFYTSPLDDHFAITEDFR
jgi:hypothetical protein